MERRSDGVWETVVELSPGRRLYGFRVDGKWELDPLNAERSEGDPAWSVLRVE
jgi:hypothetical protein